MDAELFRERTRPLRLRLERLVSSVITPLCCQLVSRRRISLVLPQHPYSVDGQSFECSGAFVVGRSCRDRSVTDVRHLWSGDLLGKTRSRRARCEAPLAVYKPAMPPSPTDINKNRCLCLFFVRNSIPGTTSVRLYRSATKTREKNEWARFRHCSRIGTSARESMSPSGHDATDGHHRYL